MHNKTAYVSLPGLLSDNELYVVKRKSRIATLMGEGLHAIVDAGIFIPSFEGN
jgi:hypothetical protein